MSTVLPHGTTHHSHGSRPDPTLVSDVRAFIRESWAKTVHHHPESRGDVIGMPRPYTVPTVTGVFQEMYYWDTFFTNEGLIIDGLLQQAIDNTENVAYLVERYGHMPNGNRTWFENRSQPPYLAMMVMRIVRETGDLRWLRRLHEVLEREHHFWTTRRLTPCGLSRYSHAGTLADRLAMVSTLTDRLGDEFAARVASATIEERATCGSHHLAEAESGWDFTPRFEARCEDFCPVDLNANLYLYETTLSLSAARLGRPSAADAWAARARRRRLRLRRRSRDPRTGLYHDYDFTHNRRSPVVSAAVFSLLFARAVSHADGARLARAALDQLEQPFGIAACAPGAYDLAYQWSYPNTWAPIIYVTAVGLANYGQSTAARRVAIKFVDVVARNFATTGNLWEKYNAVDGTVSDDDEYPVPPMLGWTAGVFVWASEFVSDDDEVGAP